MIVSRPPMVSGAPRWALAGWLGLMLDVSLVHADDWGGLATISATMGVNDGRICIGEGSRNDIGCPSYSPYVSRTNGFVGFGTSSPNAELDVLGTVSSTTANIAGTININTSGPTRWAVIKRSETYPNSQPNNLVFSFNNGSTWTQTLDLTGAGQVGVGVSQPSTSLQVRGSIRMSSEASATLQTCDTNRTGAIKYQSGDFHYCRNGSNWESLTSLTGGGSFSDRITSGTTGVYASQNTSLSLATAGAERVIIGATGQVAIGSQPVATSVFTVSGSSYFTGADPVSVSDLGTVRLVGMATTGAANTGSAIGFSGSDGTSGRIFGTLQVLKENSALNDTASYMRFATRPAGANVTERVRITSIGNVGIGTAAPNSKLDVAGTVSATTLQLADNPANPCNAANKGMAKVVDGRVYICRYP